uniref:Carbamoyltransferase n=1 Tax=Candidatus Kentrum sp. LPFa TaxID=2126335 RepID=A0A450W7I2_9GAMM|nr:MAG: carbamoyltransferase [Candidatus Kentron sp. LPFa]VFK29061.1 MAG: carbamoyltransferase [Candidatus Kentron sp. LPFa]
MYILGINAIFHESAACLIQDDRLIAIAEEERFNRIKHGKKVLIDNPDEFPTEAIAFCLAEAGIEPADVAHIGYSTMPYEFQRRKERLATGAFGEEWLDEAEWARGQVALERVPGKFQDLGFDGQFHWVDHHGAHAASAYFPSPFPDAGVLSIDGTGEHDTAVFFQGTGHRLKYLRGVPYPSSIGLLWEVLSLYLGFGIYDAAKLMGLASYGNAERFLGRFRRIISPLPDGTFVIDHDLVRFGRLEYYPPKAYLAGLEQLFGMKRRLPAEELTRDHEDIAAALQALTNELVLHMIEQLHALTGSRNLCLAGGVALNCVTNSHVFEKGPFEQLYVQPTSHDAGTAIGAAYWIRHNLLDEATRGQMAHAYWGPAYGNERIEQALRAQGLRYRVSDRLEEEVARAISEDKIVAFFQGRMETGPRALGNRSLLANPMRSDMREILNRKVKHREYFRPLAPSVLAKEAHAWFEIPKPTSAGDFMLMTYPARAEVADRIPAVVHVDGSCRIQSVRRETNPRYHRVISEFQKLTGVPVVLNTSFNDSEPIVCTPEDAIQTFLKTEIDVLAMGDYLISKADNP